MPRITVTDGTRLRFKEKKVDTVLKTIANLTCPSPHAAKDTVLLGHGSGGTLSAELIRESSCVLSRIQS